MCIAATVTVAEPPEEKLVPAVAVEDLKEDLKTAETNGRQFSHGGKTCLLSLLFMVICFMQKKNTSGILFQDMVLPTSDLVVFYPFHFICLAP